MKTLLRTLLAVAAGMAVAFALLVAVEMLSAVLHPFPKDFSGDIPAYIKTYPAWVYAIVVLLWSATAALSVWVAAKIGNQWAGIIAAVLLACALIFNLSLLPYVLWFKLAMLIALPLACLLGFRCAARRPITR